MARTQARLVALAATLLIAGSAGSAGAVHRCPADLDGDGIVTVGELVRSVGYALRGCPVTLTQCPGDVNRDGRVDVSELVDGVIQLMRGCPLEVPLVVDVAWLRERLAEDGTIEPLPTSTRPTRTPCACDARTRKPTKTPRPTRTPIPPEGRTRKATRTFAPPTTPILLTRTTTRVARPTRTPISHPIRTRHPPKSPTPTPSPFPTATAGRVQVLDARVGGFPGGHIPGALPLSPYQLATTVDGVPAQMIGASAAAEVLAEIGLDRESTVIVYGAAPEFDPARVVWALHYLGHRDVRYLDGGFAAWLASDAPVTAGDPIAADAADYIVSPVVEQLRVDGDWILERLGDPPYLTPSIQIVDARSDQEYADGRIPTAVHVRWARNLDDQGLLLPNSDLHALYDIEGLDPTVTTVVYCLAGWRASVDWLVLTELGFEDVRVYDGSWFEWGAAGAGFPIEADPEFELDGITAACSFRNKGGPASKPDLIRVFLTVRNRSNTVITDIVPWPLSISGDGAVALDSVPSSRGSMPDGSVNSFQWSFDLDGVVNISVGASAIGPGGEDIAIGPIECGVISGEPG